PTALATSIRRSTGRVRCRDTAIATTRASSAARPAAPAMARQNSVRSRVSAVPSPGPNWTVTVATRRPPTTTGACWTGPDVVVKPGETCTTVPATSITLMSAPILLARSVADMKSVLAQLRAWARDAASTEATAWLSLARWACESWSTSVAANTAVSTLSSATADSATATNASESRIPSGAVSLCLAIPAQAQAVAPAQHGLDDLGPGRVHLDLPAQVLHVRVDAALIALELVAAGPVDDLVACVDLAGDRGQRHQHAPL